MALLPETSFFEAFVQFVALSCREPSPSDKALIGMRVVFAVGWAAAEAEIVGCVAEGAEVEDGVRTVALAEGLAACPSALSRTKKRKKMKEFK